MGKGDRKTKKGKRFKGSYGVSRMKNSSNGAPQAEAKPKKAKAAPKKKAAAKPKATTKTKKTTAKKAAPKKADS